MTIQYTLQAAQGGITHAAAAAWRSLKSCFCPPFGNDEPLMGGNGFITRSSNSQSPLPRYKFKKRSYLKDESLQNTASLTSRDYKNPFDDDALTERTSWSQNIVGYGDKRGEAAPSGPELPLSTPFKSRSSVPFPSETREDAALF